MFILNIDNTARSNWRKELIENTLLQFGPFHIDQKKCVITFEAKYEDLTGFEYTNSLLEDSCRIVCES